MPPSPADNTPVPSHNVHRGNIYVSIDSQARSPIDFQADALFAHVPAATDSHIDAPALVPSSLPAADALAPVPSLPPTHATPLYHRDTGALLPSETTPLVPPPTQKAQWRRRLAIVPELICLFLSVLFFFAFALAFACATLLLAALFVRSVVSEIIKWDHIWDAIRFRSAILAIGTVAYVVLVTTLIVGGFAGMFVVIPASIIMILDALKYALVGAPRIARTRWQQMVREEEDTSEWDRTRRGGRVMV